MRSGPYSLINFAALFFAVVGLSAETEYELPPIVKERVPAEALQEDPIVPATEGKLGKQGSGGIQRGLQNKMALPVTDTGSPGGMAQFRGLGKSAEETDVQTLGIPLNPAQGGGFDFSTFPQFMWSSYRFQVGPSLSGLDPRGVAGTLNLVPWSAEAISRPGEDSGAEATQFFSGAGVVQSSVGARYQRRAAVLAGMSAGKVRGPSGSVSGRWDRGYLSARFHFLGTRLESDVPGATFFPTPNATQLSARAIPVLQFDYRITDRSVFKTSLFLDAANIHYNDPDSGFLTRDQIRQAGVENALLSGKWKIGAGMRQVQYRQIDFEAPPETIGNIQVTRGFNLGTLLIEPTAQLVAVNRYGVLPGASLGTRAEREYDDHKIRDATFLRGSFSRKLPSLTDRYYVVPGLFEGNPDLQPERDWTFILGRELKGQTWEASLQGFVQYRQDVQIPGLTLTGVTTMANRGLASIYALTGTAGYRPWGWLDVSNAVTYADSDVRATGLSYPYLPTWTDAVTAEVHPSGDNRRWSFGMSARFATYSLANAQGDRLSGYGYFDLFAGARLNRFLSLSGRAENLMDRRIEFVRGYPSPGRVFSVALSGQI